MKNEIATAVVFVTSMIKKKGTLTKEQLNTFSDKLTVALAGKYRNHWYEESPSRGQAYRCLRISPTVPQEPLLKRVANHSKLEYSQLCLPRDMVLWVDPGEVSCRFGDRGSTFLVSSFRKTVTPDENNAYNNMVSNEQSRLVTSGGSMYRYTKYSKQPVNTSYQVHSRHRNLHQDQQNLHQDQHRNQFLEEDQYTVQDQYHWSNFYNTRTVAVA
ncbi:protein BTG2-like [Antedon mediterranea]|uniref:protein BTG2-like n=1 Tax=Antedon mediterranea TaxID=105859 RepID=UPI003AF45BD9